MGRPSDVGEKESQARGPCGAVSMEYEESRRFLEGDVGGREGVGGD